MPAWIIVGAVIIGAVTLLIDRTLLLPRGDTIVVDGQAKRVRNRREAALVTAAALGAFLVLAFVGAFVEDDPLLLGLALLFGVFMIVALRRGVQVSDERPSIKDVRFELERTRGMWLIAFMGLLQVALLAAANATDGALSVILWIAQSAVMVVVFLLLWRWWRGWRAAS